MHDRVFVADDGASRVLVFESAGGIGNGMPADRVLGQPDFTAAGASTGCDGGGDGETNVCGLGSYGNAVVYVHGGAYLYVGDAAYNRVLVFDVATVEDGEAAVHVLGHSSFTGSSGAVTRPGPYSPMGVSFDGTCSWPTAATTGS